MTTASKLSALADIAAQDPAFALDLQQAASENNTDTIVCPHCGYAEPDPTFYRDRYGITGQHRHECGDCGEEFVVECDYIPVYYSHKIGEVAV